MFSVARGPQRYLARPLRKGGAHALEEVDQAGEVDGWEDDLAA